MSGLTLPIVLQIAFFALLIAEITLPSGGILGIAAAAAGVASWVAIVGMGRQELLWIFGAVDLILLPVAVWIGVKLLHHSPLANRTELNATEGFQVRIEFPGEWVGKEGVAYSTLRPAGQIKIEGRIVEALSDGPMIERGQTVIVVSIDENKLMVTPKEAVP